MNRPDPPSLARRDSRLDRREPREVVVELALPDGTVVCVANDASGITGYVLVEQEDWFEPELAFLRALARPGMRVLDVGANHGVYALSLARVVGPTGSVHAFEPAAAPATLLEHAVARNGFARLVVHRTALSDRDGSATLFGGAASELGSLVRAPGRDGGETVAVATLDRVWRGLGEPSVDIVKIDVEDHEEAVLAGAAAFFAATSPLVMFEISGSREAARRLSARFGAYGYGTYRLLPGYGLLVPCDVDELSAYQLNLFACKPDRAESLAAEGRLATGFADVPMPDGTAWPEAVLRLPCWQELLSRLRPVNPASQPGGTSHAAACALFAAAGNADASPNERAGTARTARSLIEAVAGRSPGTPSAVPQLASLARIASADGRRETAVEALRQAIALVQGGARRIELPFLPASPPFDAVDPGERVGDWLWAMLGESFVGLAAHSTLFAGGAILPMLDSLAPNPFTTARIERARQLQRLRAGLQHGLLATPAIRRGTRNLHLYAEARADAA